MWTTVPTSILNRFCFITSLVLGSALCEVRSQTDSVSQTVGIISGTVVDNETLSSIGSVQIAVLGTKIGTYSTSDGRFTIKNVPAGIRTLRVKALGYSPITLPDIAVSPGKPAFVSIKLVSMAIETDTTFVVADAFAQDAQLITSTTTFNSEEVRRLPGVQEDVVRAIALLPGIAVSSGGRNDIAVRGGAPFENLFIVDNIEVPNINHFGSQGSTGGPLSLINVDLVQSVTLSTGGFGTLYGDKLSSVTNLALRDGNNKTISGELNLSTTGFSAIGEGPIGESGSWLVAARRSYLDLIFNLAGFGFIPEYWDFTTKAKFSISSKDEISFLAIGALDKVTFNNSEDNLYSNSRVTAPSQNQYFAGVTWKHLFSDGYTNVTLGRTYSNYNTVQQDSLANTIFKAQTQEGENSLRADVVWLASTSIELNAGLIGKYASDLSYDVVLPGYVRLDSVGKPAPLAVDTTFQAGRGGFYAQLKWKALDQLSLTLGTRFDVYTMISQNTAVSPRASISYTPSQGMMFSVSGGIYQESPQYIWLIGDPNNKNQLRPIRADQVVASWQWVATPDFRIQLEVYYKVYSNYPARKFRPQAVIASSGFDDVYTDIPFGLEPLDGIGSGKAFGGELLLQKKLSESIPLYGLLSLSLNQTEFTSIDDTSRTGTFDTPFILSFSLGWRPDDQWEISGKVRASEGAPTTPYITTSERAQETGFPVGSLDFAFYNNGNRLPTFFALDLRVDKRWFFPHWQLITYIDVQNITGRENVAGYQWNSQTLQVEARTSIGVLPSIGINIEF